MSSTSLLVMHSEPDVPAPAPGFGSWQTSSHRWQETYDARGYVELILSQGDHRLLPETQRTRLVRAVAETIAAHGDCIRYEYSTDLSIAMRAGT